jgi:hypothetical protein
MSRRTIVLALLAALVLTTIGPASAQTSGGGDLTSDSVRATARDLGAGTFGGPGLPTVAPDIESPFTWSPLATGARCVVFAGVVPPAIAPLVSPLPSIPEFTSSPLQVGALQGGVPGVVRVEAEAALPPDATVVGRFDFAVGQPRDTSRPPYVVPMCSVTGVARMPEPPTAAEIWEQTPLPRARVDASPPGTRAWPGIVNLESRFWVQPLPDAHAIVSLDGYVVDVSARPIAYGWTLADGTTSVRETPGSAEDPLRVTFRRRGDQLMRLHVVWQGTGHVIAPFLGLDLGDVELGTVALPLTTTHSVAEIRALLRARTARR